MSVKVLPRSGHTGVDGILGDFLKIRLSSPPVDGKANKELISFIAETIRVPRNAVNIIHGQKSQKKRVFVSGVSVYAIVMALKLPAPQDRQPISSNLRYTKKA